MGNARYTEQGFRDYRLVTLEDIVKDLQEDFLPFAKVRAKKLNELIGTVKDNSEDLDDPQDIIEYMEWAVSIFEGIEHELKRILIDIENGVREPHLDIIDQIHSFCVSAYEGRGLFYKKNHMTKKLKKSSLRPLLDKIYSMSRGGFFHYFVFSDVSKRLRTYLGTSGLSDMTKEPISPKIVKPIVKFPAPKGITWKDVTIKFISTEAVQIRAGNVEDAQNYREMGFEAKNKPDCIWETLGIFAKCDGVIKWDDQIFCLSDKDKWKKRFSKLRKRLKNYFDINDNPIIYKTETVEAVEPKVEKVGHKRITIKTKREKYYELAFNISIAESVKEESFSRVHRISGEEHTKVNDIREVFERESSRGTSSQKIGSAWDMTSEEYNQDKEDSS